MRTLPITNRQLAIIDQIAKKQLEIIENDEAIKKLDEQLAESKKKLEVLNKTLKTA